MPYIAALITLDPIELAGWDRGTRPRRRSGGVDNAPEVHALVQAIVDDVNGSHSRFEQIKRFAILPRDFSTEEGEVTPTLKLRRRTCQEHFAGEIDRLYAPTS